MTLHMYSLVKICTGFGIEFLGTRSSLGTNLKRILAKKIFLNYLLFFYDFIIITYYLLYFINWVSGIFLNNTFMVTTAAFI